MLLMSMILETIWTLLIVGTITFVIVLLLIFARINIDMSDEVFRKLMHMSAILMTPMCLILSDNYRSSAAVLLIFALLSEIGLRIFPRIFDYLPIGKVASGTELTGIETDGTLHTDYETFFVERNSGEVRRSFVMYCLLQACLIIVCGLFNDMGIIILEIAVWGVGDAVAALVGKNRGVRHFTFADTNKTYLGSAFMCVSAFIISIILLISIYAYSPIRIITESIIIAVLATAAELFSKKGIDTITIPIVVTAVALGFNYLM